MHVSKCSKMHQKVHKALGEKHACYVLITCGEPNGQGKMEVEMTYEGDETLAAFLIESAHNVILENQGELRDCL